MANFLNISLNGAIEINKENIIILELYSEKLTNEKRTNKIKKIFIASRILLLFILLI